MAYSMDIAMNDTLEILKNSSRVNSVINTIKLIDREFLFLTGGALRNVIWNSLHYYSEYYEIEDCDLIFFNESNITKQYEEFLKKELNYLNPTINWSVKNQARMHIKNNHLIYKDIPDALRKFPETCSALAIDKNWNIVVPYGLNDLLNLSVKPTKFCIDNELDVFFNRVAKKKWLTKWPGLILDKSTTQNKSICKSMAGEFKISYVQASAAVRP
jgi:hypothetical protein